MSGKPNTPPRTIPHNFFTKAGPAKAKFRRLGELTVEHCAVRLPIGVQRRVLTQRL